jgi:hypothetical protein
VCSVECKRCNLGALNYKKGSEKEATITQMDNAQLDEHIGT